MRITFLTSVTVAVAGGLQDVLGLSHRAISVNEPVWLLLWGVGLMSLVATLRAKISARRAVHANSKNGSGLESTDRSIAGTV